MEPYATPEGVVRFDSLGDFAETGDGQLALTTPFEASRGSGGWSTESLAPSAAMFQYDYAPTIVTPRSPWEFSAPNQLFGTVAGEALFMAVPRSAPTPDFRIYRREHDSSGQPQFVEVGPTLAPATVAGWQEADGQASPGFLGASADLSHVFFQFREYSENRPERWLWPGDPALGPVNIYEYAGTHNTEPTLVNIKPGPREGEALPAENPEVLSQCGAALGSYANEKAQYMSALDKYNAISESGETVFFTPAVV